MSVGEALTNLVWAQVSALEHVKCSGNWMWAAKLPGEGAALRDAALAMRDVMIELGIAVDGGKDSISMAALAPTPEGDDEIVKAPGSLVISAYVTCPDINKTVTPDFKLPGEGTASLRRAWRRPPIVSAAPLWRKSSARSAMKLPDLEDAAVLKRAFEVVQKLVAEKKVTAGHDVSDGGLVTTLLEMAFAGNCGLNVELVDRDCDDPIAFVFAEELGLVMEVRPEDEAHVIDSFKKAEVPCVTIGKVENDPTVRFASTTEWSWKKTHGI